MYRKLNYIFVGVLMLNFISCGQQNSKSSELQTEEIINEQVLENSLSIKTIENENQEISGEIKMLKKFYYEYLSKSGDLHKDNDKQIDLRQKFTTENLQQQFYDPDIDWDILVNGQFSEENWRDNMFIYADSVGTNNFIVVFTYERPDYGKNCKFVVKNSIKLHVIKDGNDYKIDKALSGEYEEIYPEGVLKEAKEKYIIDLEARSKKEK